MLVEQLSTAPNPQFVRPGWQDLSGPWKFAHDDADIGVLEQWFRHPERLEREIIVPFPPESRLSGVHDTAYHPVIWYTREFPDIRTSDQPRQLVTFGAVDYEATVWVDGIQVGSHRGGHTPFTVDVTDALDPGISDHVLVVRAADDPHDLEQPRGKQDWLPEPHVIWYHRTSGIWQPVWTEASASVRIEHMRWRFDPARWLIDYEIELTKAPPTGAELTIELEFEGNTIARSTIEVTSRIVTGQLSPGPNPQRLLWSIDRPNLVGATLTFVSADERDVVQTYLGLRTVSLTGSRFLINGRPVFLRLVLEQGYWPESHLAAPSGAAIKREVELIRELGFNGARIHQKVEDPRFLFWADRLGVLIWGEIANAFVFSERAIDRHTAEWREAVLRDRNHPCVIAWVPFNESWGVGEIGYALEQQEAVKAAYHRTHMLDGTRPVVGNDGWEYVEGDLLTIHDYTWDANTLRERYSRPDQLGNTLESHFPGSRRIVVGDSDASGKPVMVTEYGGVSYAPNSGEEWFGYGKVGTDDEFLAKYRDLTDPLNESALICGFCYTQLTDTIQETNGLLDENRQPKVPIERICEITSGIR